MAIGRQCIICKGFIPLYGGRDTTQICNKCIDKLYEILYPDQEKEDK